MTASHAVFAALLAVSFRSTMASAQAIGSTPMPVHHGMTATDSLFESFVPDSVRHACVSFVQPTLRAEGDGTTEACAFAVDGVDSYAYVTATGAVTVAGRAFHPDSSSVAGMSDSVEAALRRRFGGPTICTLTTWTSPPVTRSLQWLRGDYIVQFRSTIGTERRTQLYPKYVGYELVRGLVACNDWIGAPEAGDVIDSVVVDSIRVPRR